MTKEAAKGGRVADMSALSIQCCDWPTWQQAARSANHSTETTSFAPAFTVGCQSRLNRGDWSITDLDIGREEVPVVDQGLTELAGAETHPVGLHVT